MAESESGQFLQQLHAQPNAESDSKSENDDSHGDESGLTNEGQTQDNTDTYQTVIQTVVDTFKAEAQTTLDDKVSSIVNLQKLVLTLQQEDRQKVGEQIVESGLLDIWIAMVKKTTNIDGETAGSAESSEQWEITNIIYQVLVKISDVSKEFNKQVASTDLIKCTVVVLKSEHHKDLCVKEVGDW